MGNKLNFLVQCIQGCGHIKAFGNIRRRKISALPKFAQSIAGFHCVISVRVKEFLFLHSYYFTQDRADLLPRLCPPVAS